MKQESWEQISRCTAWRDGRVREEHLNVRFQRSAFCQRFRASCVQHGSKAGGCRGVNHLHFLYADGGSKTSVKKHHQIMMNAIEETKDTVAPRKEGRLLFTVAVNRTED